MRTATTKRAFSAMKFVKTRFRNRMEDDFLASFLITYFETGILPEISMMSLS